jgi:hypothetical protein
MDKFNFFNLRNKGIRGKIEISNNVGFTNTEAGFISAFNASKGNNYKQNAETNEIIFYEKIIVPNISSTGINVFIDHNNIVEELQFFAFEGQNLQEIFTGRNILKIGDYAFRSNSTTKFYFLDNLIELGRVSFRGTRAEYIYMPKVTMLGRGDPAQNDFIFEALGLNCEIHLPIIHQTSNNGNPDANVAQALSRGANIIWH